MNVGGTSILPMAELRSLCEQAGLSSVRTYIQSGNVVFESAQSEAEAKTVLEATVGERLGKRARVIVRSAAEMRSVLDRNPFPDAEPKKVAVHFFDEPADATSLVGVTAPGGEEIVAAGREIYVYYPEGMGRSKLKLPAAAPGTARNINTVAKLAEMSALPVR